MLLIHSCIEYVCNAPYFWGSMGFTTALGMFIGAVLYDGNLNHASKGAFSVLTYAGMVFWITSMRLFNSTIQNPVNAYAGLTTMILTTLAWICGLLMGVAILNLKYRNLPH